LGRKEEIKMHSKHNDDYTIHYNGDFSQVKYVSRKTQEEQEIPPSLFSLLHAAIMENFRRTMDDLVDNTIYEQNVIGERNQHYWEEENGKI
jgi:hypothetical protein